MADKPLASLTDKELEQALQDDPLRQEHRRREEARSREWDAKRKAENDQLLHEMAVRYSAEAGLTIDHFNKLLEDVFWPYFWEYDEKFR